MENVETEALPHTDKTLYSCVKNSALTALRLGFKKINFTNCINKVSSIIFTQKSRYSQDVPYPVIRKEVAKKAYNERNKLNKKIHRNIFNNDYIYDMYQNEYLSLDFKAFDYLLASGIFDGTKEQTIHLCNFVRILHRDYEYTMDLDGKREKPLPEYHFESSEQEKRDQQAIHRELEDVKRYGKSKY